MRISGKILGFKAQDKNYVDQQNLQGMQDLLKNMNQIPKMNEINAEINKIAKKLQTTIAKPANKEIKYLIIEIDKSQTETIDNKRYLPIKEVKGQIINSYYVEVQFDQEHNRNTIIVDTEQFSPVKSKHNNLAYASLFSAVEKNISIEFNTEGNNSGEILEIAKLSFNSFSIFD